MALKKTSNVPDLIKTTEKFKKTVVRKIANLAKNHYLEGFRRGGKQTDKSRNGWKERKLKNKKNRGRAILVKSGNLFRDLDVRKTTFEEIVLGTSSLTEDYASVHNDGGMSGRGQGFQMPQREFLGSSRKLDAKIKRKIFQELKKAYG